jgi:uncharacterized protein with HEPN domain
MRRESVIELLAAHRELLSERFDVTALTLRNLELIGEAASRVPNEVRESNPDIPWRMIISKR